MSDEVARSAIPRVPFADLPAALTENLAPRVERLGYLGEFFQCGAHQPEALLEFNRFTDASKAAAGTEVAEVAALTASVMLGNVYERHQHERLCVALGMSVDWVAAVELLSPVDAPLLSPQQRAAQAATVALLLNHGHGAGSAVEDYARGFGAAAAIALLFVVGRFAAHALFANGLAFAPPVSSILEDVPR